MASTTLAIRFRASRYRDLITIFVIWLFSLALRLWNLSTPRGLVFDELYYVDGARDYLKNLVEVNETGPEFVVHPPLGKWLIAGGIKLFGDNEFGWRFSAALVGSLSIVLIFFVAKKLFASYFLSTSAALLAAFDGLNLVLSRTALLDIFLMFFLLLAFYLFIQENHWLVGIAFGLALSIKWNALYSLTAFAIYAIFLQIKHNPKLLPLRIFQYSILPFFIYLFSWWGWLVTDKGWSRNWSGNRFTSLWHYQSEILNFHTTLTDVHSYSANPWSWLIMGRPTSFFYESPKTCGTDSCAQEVLALGTPLLWWLGTISIAVTFGYFISRRDKTAGLILLALSSAYLPWFLFQQRTMFTFYAISFEPFLILTIIYSFARFLENPENRKRNRKALLYLLLVIALCFLYFLPVFIGQILTYSAWVSRMWFPSWI